MEHGRNMVARLLTDPFWVTGAIFLGAYLLIGVQERRQGEGGLKGNAAMEQAVPNPAGNRPEAPPASGEMRS